MGWEVQKAFGNRGREFIMVWYNPKPVHHEMGWVFIHLCLCHFELQGADSIGNSSFIDINYISIIYQLYTDVTAFVYICVLISVQNTHI